MLYLLTFVLLCFPAFGNETTTIDIAEVELLEVASLSRKPSFDGTWGQVPTVYICPGTPITSSRVRNAMRVWQRLGYDMIGPIQPTYMPECFANAYKRGAILIKLRGQSFNETNLAMTQTYRFTDTREIIAAVIQIQAFAPEKERVIEHEIGHAFGWHHFNRRYHLMHSMHVRGGWDTYGLRRRNE